MTFLGYLRRNPALAIGLVLTLSLIAIAVLSLVWTPDNPTVPRMNLRLRGPFEAGLLGTDRFGRDMLSRIIIGARTTLIIAWPAVLIGASIGILLASLAASRRGWIEEVIMRACDITFAFPALIVAIMINTAVNGGAMAAAWAIALFNIPVFARVARNAARKIWAMDYVLAAKAAGKTRWAIAIQDVLPNIVGILLIQLMVQLAMAIVMEAGFAYVGIGVPPTEPSWGRMLRDGQDALGVAPHLILAPGAAIAFAVLGLNLLSDGLRELFDTGQSRGKK